MPAGLVRTSFACVSPSQLLINDGNGVFTEDGNSALASASYCWRDAGDDSEITGVYQNGITLADLDDDDDLDVLIAGSYRSALFINDGDGNFVEEESFEAFLSAIPGDYGFDTFTAGDLDMDGDVDLIAASSYGNHNLVLHNDGTGSFTHMSESSISQGTPLSTYMVRLGDVDNDGDLECARPSARRRPRATRTLFARPNRLWPLPLSVSFAETTAQTRCGSTLATA